MGPRPLPHIRDVERLFKTLILHPGRRGRGNPGRQAGGALDAMLVNRQQRFIENVPAAVWNNEVSGKWVLTRARASRNWRRRRGNRGGPGLISADQLRAAGACDFPPGWRKSLSVEQDRLPLFGDDDTVATKQQPTPRDAESDELSEELP